MIFVRENVFSKHHCIIDNLIRNIKKKTFIKAFITKKKGKKSEKLRLFISTEVINRNAFLRKNRHFMTH